MWNLVLVSGWSHLLAASFLAEGITHPEDVGTLAPRGALYLVLELHINCIQVSRVGAERARIPGWVVQCGGPVSIAPRSGLSRKGSPSPTPRRHITVSNTHRVSQGNEYIPHVQHTLTVHGNLYSFGDIRGCHSHCC